LVIFTVILLALFFSNIKTVVSICPSFDHQRLAQCRKSVSYRQLWTAISSFAVPDDYSHRNNSPNSITSICCGFVVQQIHTTNPQQLDIHLTHSRRRLAIESHANYVIMLR